LNRLVNCSLGVSPGFDAAKDFTESGERLLIQMETEGNCTVALNCRVMSVLVGLETRYCVWSTKYKTKREKDVSQRKAQHSRFHIALSLANMRTTPCAVDFDATL
jgi:hypothetical protein